MLERAERRPISVEAFWHIANWADAAPSSYVWIFGWLERHDRRQDNVFRVPFDPAVDLGRVPG